MHKEEMSQRVKPSFWRVLWFIIFTSFIGFGGGNALLPIFKRYSVDKYRWLSEKEFEENVILTNMLPGASVIEALSYIAFKTLGFWKAMIVIVFGVLPHVIFGFLIFYFTKYIPLKYLFVIEVAVLSTIIGSLIVFIYNYVKKGLKAIKQWLWFVLFLITFVYALFVPAPYNMPVIIMVTIMLIFTIVYFSRKKVIINKKNNKADLIDTHKNHKEGGR